MQCIQKAAEALDREYRCFLDYITSQNVKLSSRTGNLGKQDCAKLNRQFQLVREPYEKVGRTQEFFAVIDFFCFFSIKTAIFKIVKRKGGGKTLQVTDRGRSFLQMPVQERYLLMLSVWFYYYRETVRDHSFFSNWFLSCVKTAEEGKEIGIATNRYLWGDVYCPDIRLFALFGIVQIHWLEAAEVDCSIEKTNKFRIKSVVFLKAGNLWREKNKSVLEDGLWLEEDGFQCILRANGGLIEGCDDEMINRLENFMTIPVQSGSQTVLLKVQTGDCVRRIQMGDQDTLDDLHYYIQKSVDFTMDHLYYFVLGSGSRRQVYFAPQCCDEEMLADEVELAELFLYEGMRFQYVFDFGDEWHFGITVERIWDEHTDKAELTAVKGENPRQYEDWPE